VDEVSQFDKSLPNWKPMRAEAVLIVERVMTRQGILNALQMMNIARINAGKN